MSSKLKDKIDDLKSSAFEIALIPIDFVLRPVTRYYINKNHLTRTLAENISIDGNWTEISIEPAVEGAKRFQCISLFIESCSLSRNPDKKTRVKLPNGKHIEPEVKIFDLDGNCFDTKGGSFSVGTVGSQFDAKSPEVFRQVLMNFSISEKDRRYVKVAVRSKKHAFECREVLWKDFNLK